MSTHPYPGWSGGSGAIGYRFRLTMPRSSAHDQDDGRGDDQREQHGGQVVADLDGHGVLLGAAMVNPRALSSSRASARWRVQSSTSACSEVSTGSPVHWLPWRVRYRHCARLLMTGR